MSSAVRPERGLAAAAGTRPGGPHRALLPLGIVLGGAALALLLQVVFDPFSTHVPLCIVHQLTGIECPGCGATRAVHALLAGDLLLALRNNVLIVVALPLTVAGFVVWTARRVQGRTTDLMPSPGVVLVLAAIVGIFTVLRNLPAFWFIAPTSLVGA